jgi:hypothetical protein
LINPGIIFDENIVLNDCYIDDGQTAFIPAIFTEDCNVQNYSELDPLICEYHFHDAAHPIPNLQFFTHPTFGLTLTCLSSRQVFRDASTIYSFEV